MKLNTYKIEFDTADSWGMECLETRTADEAIDLFREYYPKEDYAITGVFRVIGGETGADFWKDR